MSLKDRGPKGKRVGVFDPRILKLLTFLTRKQAWLSPPEVARAFRPDGRAVSVMTLYRWFAMLEDRAGFSYFPYPRMNELDLADVYVRIRGPRTPVVLGVVPFGHSFLAEVGLDGRPFLSQEFWIPGPGRKAFEEYWKTAVDLHLVEQADLIALRNPHYVFSPFHETIREDGWVEISSRVDNDHFERLLRQRLREPHEVRLSPRIAAAPLIIPIVLEHLWRHWSSKRVWDAVRAKRASDVRAFAKGRGSKSLSKPGAALQVLQREWREFLERFDDFFLQPVVLVPPGLLLNCQTLSFSLRPGGTERVLELAMRASRYSLTTAVMPETGPNGGCRIWCNAPSSRLSGLLRLMHEYHQGRETPVFGVVDLDATGRLARPDFCGFDWRSFDPKTLRWRFDGESYVERLKGLVTPTPTR
ncbi:MAG TPA: hypothetical protein VI893_02615 [Thermoplasmata archaeon]|nr:hypothetical protein [Thermoplasmata archaeon]